MSEPQQDIQVEIQKTLASINDVTIIIKKELMMIIDLIREEGRLGTAVKDANKVLSNVLHDLGIEITAVPSNTEESEEQSDDRLVPVTLDLINKKLLSFTEDTEAQSQ